MTPRTWAEKEGNRIARDMSMKEATYRTIARGLQREHQRAVRIIKKRLTAIEEYYEKATTDYVRDMVWTSVLELRGVLAALERGGIKPA